MTLPTSLDHQAILALCQGALRIAERTADPARICQIAMQTAEAASILDDEDSTREYLSLAHKYLAQIYAAPAKNRDDRLRRRNLSMNLYFAMGRSLYHLTERFRNAPDSHEARRFLLEADVAFRKSGKMCSKKPDRLLGDIAIFMADLNWWRARCSYDLGRLDDTVRFCQEARSGAAMYNPRFAEFVGLRTKVLEAEANLFAGDITKASMLADEVIKDERTSEDIRRGAEAVRNVISVHVTPLLDWFSSSDAKSVTTNVQDCGLAAAVKIEVSPLINWLNWWQRDGLGDAASVMSPLLDFWGRGGFARVASAVRSDPLAAVTVDAFSIEDIRAVARALCPLFETVIVKYKGKLESAMVMGPIHESIGEVHGGTFGGHGYAITLGSRIGENWIPFMGWGNLFPEEIGSFLATEGRTLIAAGRLVVVPASLVGCSQSKVGWTDNLLVDGLLGGTVDIVHGSRSRSVAGGRRQRVIDIAAVSLPFIDGVPLTAVAQVADESAEWLLPLRRLLIGSLESGALRWENWESIRALELDIRQASMDLRERLKAIANRSGFVVRDVRGSLTAAAVQGPGDGRDNITALLRSVARSLPQSAPWIPFFRLEQMGGHLNWFGPLDNGVGPVERQSTELRSWLHPGTGGWWFPTGSFISKPGTDENS